MKIFNFADDAGGAYTWKARGRNNKGTGPWKEVSFNLTTLATPVITAPSDGGHVEGNPGIAFTWNAVTGASGYYVEILTGTTPVTQAYTPNLTMNFVLAPGSYTVRVTAMADGESRPDAISFTADEP
jgi:hypothetical protein